MECGRGIAQSTRNSDQKWRPTRTRRSSFSDSDHAAIARAFGPAARRVENPGEIAPVIEEGLSSKGAYLLDVVVQPLEQAGTPVAMWIA